MGGLTPKRIVPDLPAAAHRWAERTCQEQGLPVNINDPATVTRVAAVLRQVSDPPNRFKPGGVEPVAVERRSDHHVIENGGENGSALVEIELGPLPT
jgi:hypothetical protein